jgi:hypothetical protein
LSCANVKFVQPGSVGKIAGGKTVPIDTGSACFSGAFAASLPPGCCPNISLDKVAGNCHWSDKDDTH